MSMHSKWIALIAAGTLTIVACGSDDASSTTAAVTTAAPLPSTTVATPTSASPSSTPPSSPSSEPATTVVPSEPSAELIAAAKAEGVVTFYSGQGEALLAHIAKEFTKKYGIKVEYQRVLSADLLTRFQAESESDSVQADLLISGYEPPRGDKALTTEFHDKGWVRYLDEVGLPVAGFPADYVFDGKIATVLVQPMLIAVNTEMLAEADRPTSFEDLTDPRFKDQICLNNPLNSVNSYIGTFDAIYERYGEQWFAGFRANNPRVFDGGGPAIQALAAGECSVNVLQSAAGVSATMAQGAPVAVALPDFTSAVENQIILVSEKNSKHPNAGVLFAHWLLSEEGSRIANDDEVLGVPGGIFSPWAEDQMPDMHFYDASTGITKDEMGKLTGVA